MTSHDHKQFLGIAGEFLVAGELNRRWISASISFGHSKKADISIYNSDKKKILRVEVKTTVAEEWPLGKKVIDESLWSDDWFWVLIHFPNSPAVEYDQITDDIRGMQAPRYYVLTSRELGLIAKRNLKAYFDRYKAKHGKDYSEVFLPTASVNDVSDCEDDWHKIQSSYLFHKQSK